MNTNPHILSSLEEPSAQRECVHAHMEIRHQFLSDGFYTWKVCVQCGYECDYTCQDVW